MVSRLVLTDVLLLSLGSPQKFFLFLLLNLGSFKLFPCNDSSLSFAVVPPHAPRKVLLMITLTGSS